MADLAGKNVILTGATGFIGRYVAGELVNAGAQVYAVVRPDSPHIADLPHKPGLSVLLCDMEHIPEAYMNAAANPCAEIKAVSKNPVSAVDKLSGAGASGDASANAGGSSLQYQPPFAFLHFAWGGVNRGEIDTDEVQQKNIDLSISCINAAVELGCEVFMDAGSRVEYGITQDGVMEEHMPCHPVNAYGRAKLRFYEHAARIAKDNGLTYYHLRFFSVYGVGDHPWSVISTLTRDLPQGKTVSLSACLHRWNFMHVVDASRAVAGLLQNSASFKGQVNTVNVAGPDTRVLKDFVQEIYELCRKMSDKCGTLEYGTFEQAKEGALSICPVTEELKRLTSGTWEETVSFAEGVTELMRLNLT